jgi:parallel beta-helix repeat protein
MVLVLLTGLALTYGYALDMVNTQALTPHAPIKIDGNEAFTLENGVTRGSGTDADPYFIEGWEITGREFGVIIENTDAHFVIRNCRISGKDLEGIRFTNVENGRIEESELEWNIAAIVLEKSLSCTIYGNTLVMNGPHISLSESFDNKITDNIVGDCFGCPCIQLSRSAGNLLYRNQFRNDIFRGACPFDSGANHWDGGYPIGGNFWQEYEGKDEYSGPNQDQPGADGIGDTPFAIPGGANLDRYPLMTPL